ncbi:asl4753 [Nostoc sp. PCC 7120 = FACHB-418]|nr:asl4753 [Nostoc sp. PCC 7120 = FACHB-418]
MRSLNITGKIACPGTPLKKQTTAVHPALHTARVAALTRKRCFSDFFSINSVP